MTEEIIITNKFRLEKIIKKYLLEEQKNFMCCLILTKL